MDRAGRVPILLFAGVGQCVSCFFLAYYYFFASCTRDSAGTVVEAPMGTIIDLLITIYGHITLDSPPLQASMGVFPIVILYCYVFFFSCGMGAIPWFIMGEIFKTSVKGTASSIATAVNWLMSFLITFSVASITSGFEDALKDALPDAIDRGMGGLFTLYGLVCLFGVAFVSTVVPETKGLTAREVQHKLAGHTGKVGRGSFRESFHSNQEEGNTFHAKGEPAKPRHEHEGLLNV